MMRAQNDRRLKLEHENRAPKKLNSREWCDFEMKTETIESEGIAGESVTKTAARKLTSREEILNAEDMRQEQVDVSEWGWAKSAGGKVLAKCLTALERSTLAHMSTFNIDGELMSEQTSVDTVILGTYDLNNPMEKLFKLTDRDALLEHNSAPFEKVAGVINKLSGISLESKKKIEKN
jgi:hypothetical protein